MIVMSDFPLTRSPLLRRWSATDVVWLSKRRHYMLVICRRTAVILQLMTLPANISLSRDSYSPRHRFYSTCHEVLPRIRYWTLLAKYAIIAGPLHSEPASLKKQPASATTVKPLIRIPKLMQINRDMLYIVTAAKIRIGMTSEATAWHSHQVR
jgi:hypothetical protein